MATQYNPLSHFFTEQDALSNADPANVATDAFGPVFGKEATEYRTTSFIRATTITKVFAICRGKILIQPMTGSDTKVNLILKPDACYSPLKIKYFIYRGVNKSDLILDYTVVPYRPNDPTQPDIVKSLWSDFLKYNSLNQQATTIFPPYKIGYDPNEQPSSMLLDECFNIPLNEPNKIPTCMSGQHLGNFSGTLGLDIVLDYGDYRLINQEELFKIDLDFARKTEHIFNLSAIVSSTAIKIKRYKEYIHQFIDAAAFWGSHIGCGLIKTNENQLGIGTNDDIFTHILNKYQTKNKIYVYIQAENNRSYNYFETTRTVEGFTVPQRNETYGWPIIIQELTLETDPEGDKSIRNFDFEYNTIIYNQFKPERHISIDVIAPYNDTSLYPKLQRPLNGNIGRTNKIELSFSINNKKSCATFVLFYVGLKQEFPLKNYYNQLCPANFDSSFAKPIAETNYLYSATFDKSMMVNLDDVLDAGVSIQNKLFFDLGRNSPPVSTGKKRRLYMAILKRNTKHNKEYDDLNINNVTASKVKVVEKKEEYILNLYNDINFSIYKGTFTDGTTINSLTLIHENSLTKRNSFFHLGITDEEYNKLIYDNITGTSPQILPIDADNVFFHLEENTNFGHENVRKFKLGLHFEDNTGAFSSPIFPTSPINVYTIDGFYFFSKDYSEFQQFYSDFAKAKVEFRTANSYNGKFGFDWLREGDNGEPAYRNIIKSGYKRPVDANDPNSIEFEVDTSTGKNSKAFKALKREYKSVPTQKLDEQYFIPYLNLFSQTYSNTITIIPPPPFMAELRVLVEIDETLNKLEFDYDTTIFTINKPILTDKIKRSKGLGADGTIQITCLRDFSDTKQIKILAYPVGITDKKQAKLAGMILLDKNNDFSRKVLKTVLVRVKIMDSAFGSFSTQEKLNLRTALYQSFIYADVEEVDLALQSDSAFFAGGTYRDNEGYIKYDEQGIEEYLKAALFSINIKYGTYFIAFAFDVETKPRVNADGSIENTVGKSQGFGAKCIIVYKGKDELTLCHESLHGLGLYHTHGSIISANQKFTYANGNIDRPNATDNYLSYSGNLRKTIWKWQIKIIHSNLI